MGYRIDEQTHTEKDQRKEGIQTLLVVLYQIKLFNGLSLTWLNAA